MTYNKCPKNNNCKINCLLIIDTNSIFYLIQALINDIEIYHSQLSREDKFNYFCEKISSLLERFSICSLNRKLNISEVLYNYEISPTLKINNRQSTLRRKIGDFNTMCGHLNRNFQKIETILNDHFNIHSENDRETDEFRHYFPISIRPYDRDASLILLGLKKANSDCETLILTNDNKIEKAYDYLINRSNIILNFGQFNTSRLFIFSYFDFLTILHNCCQISTEEYKNLYHQYFAAEQQHIRNSSQLIQRFIQKKLDKYSQIYVASITQKLTI